MVCMKADFVNAVYTQWKSNSMFEYLKILTFWGVTGVFAPFTDERGGSLILRSADRVVFLPPPVFSIIIGISAPQVTSIQTIGSLVLHW